VSSNNPLDSLTKFHICRLEFGAMERGLGRN
jgi:hypothetical protein